MASQPSFDESTGVSSLSDDTFCAWPSYFGLQPHTGIVSARLAGHWQIHQYFFGALFALIAAQSAVGILRLWKRRHFLSRCSFLLLNAGICTLACARSVFLLLDAHNDVCTYPTLPIFVLYSFVFPCLVSCTSALASDVVRASGAMRLKDSIALSRALPCFVSFHLAFALVALVVAYLYAAARLVLFAYQVFTAFWSFFLWVSYVALVRLMRGRASQRQSVASKSISKSMGLSTKHAQQQKLTLVLAVNSTVAVVSLCLLLCLLEAYKLVRMAMPASFPADWHWWAVQNGTRCVEAALCLSLSYVALLPFRCTLPMVGRPGSASSSGRRSASVTCRKGAGFLCSSYAQLCSSDDNEYLIPVPEWTTVRDEDADCLGLHQVKRQESTKSDLYPLHLITRSGDGLAVAAAAAAAAAAGHSYGSTSGNSAAMLAAEHGKLLWKHVAVPAAQQCSDREGGASEDGRSDISFCENPHYYHSATDVSQQPTLKVDRDLAEAYAELQGCAPAAAAAATAAAIAAGVQPSRNCSCAEESCSVTALVASADQSCVAEQPRPLSQHANRRHDQAIDVMESRLLLADASDSRDEEDDDDISQLSVHVEDGQCVAELEAHV